MASFDLLRRVAAKLPQVATGRKALSTVALALAGTLIASLASVEPALAQNVHERILKEKKMTIGYAAVRPWAFRDSSGNLFGIEPEIIREIFPDVQMEVVI